MSLGLELRTSAGGGASPKATALPLQVLRLSKLPERPGAGAQPAGLHGGRYAARSSVPRLKFSMVSSRSTVTKMQHLLQLDIIEKMLPKVGKEQWQTLYLNGDAPPDRFGIWCALLNKEAAAKAMTHDSWDLTIGDGMPGFSQSWTAGAEVTTYERFGSSPGVRPLILHRSFEGAFRQYVELDEEFRLYHNLAKDRRRGLLLSFDASGREIEVVRITPNKVQAQLKYLRQFQAGTGLHLAVYIDSRRYSQIRLTDIPEDEQRRVEAANSLRWNRTIAESPNWVSKKEFETFSRLLGKAILPPPSRAHAGVWPFTEDNTEPDVEFIIGVDQDGNEVEFTSNHNDLSNNFGANPGAHHYLTPVYFRREVLGKYYSEHERYSVSDGQLNCLGLWSCRIDNDLASHVVVWLGDLGRDLPYEERLHWRQFNVPPEGGVSETSFHRNILAEFTDAAAPDLVFRRKYSDLMTEWEEMQGWPLFLPPSPGDDHLLNTIRVPVTNSQGEFDEQVIHLAKLLVDSLNEKELKSRATGLENGAKGIRKLDGFLEATQFPQRRELVQFLKNLQTLRSTGSAHRKGSRYKKITTKLGVQSLRKPDAFRQLLGRAAMLLQALRPHYCGQSYTTGDEKGASYPDQIR